MKKLRDQIQESTEGFDEALYTLFYLKIKVEMVIYQEELKIQRLRYSMLVEEEFSNRERELTKLVKYKRKLKVSTVIGQRLNCSSLIFPLKVWIYLSVLL